MQEEINEGFDRLIELFFENEVMVASALVAMGVVFCFFGLRLFKFYVGALGFLIVGGLAATAGFAISGEVPVAVLLGVVGGVIGAILSVVLYFLGVFVFGGWSGVLLLLVVTKPYLGAIPDSTYTVMLLLAFFVVGFTAVMLQRIVIILGSALHGALGIAIGISMLLGRDIHVEDAFVMESVSFASVREYQAEILACVLLAVFGVMFQLWHQSLEKSVVKSGARTTKNTEDDDS